MDGNIGSAGWHGKAVDEALACSLHGDVVADVDSRVRLRAARCLKDVSGLLGSDEGHNAVSVSCTEGVVVVRHGLDVDGIAQKVVVAIHLFVHTHARKLVGFSVTERDWFGAVGVRVERNFALSIHLAFIKDDVTQVGHWFCSPHLSCADHDGQHQKG